MLKEVLLIVGGLTVFAPTNLCMPDIKLDGEVELPGEEFKINDTQVINEGEENNTLSAVNETLFWALPDTGNTTASVMDEQNVQDSSTTEESVLQQSANGTAAVKEPSISADESVSEEKNPNGSSQINDGIILSRKNCHAEIAIHENADTKLTIKFEHLQNNSYGRCCVTLSGHKNNMLGVLISNVHLYRNNTQGEVLKVIVGDSYSTFTLKEYYGENGYEPLLLTETYKVYLVLYYKVGYIASNHDCTYFDLEVFTYHKTENNIHHHEEHKDNYNRLYVNPADEIHPNEEKGYFIPYIQGRV